MNIIVGQLLLIYAPTVNVEETIPTISACRVSLINSSNIAFCNTSLRFHVSLMSRSVVFMFSSQGGRPLGIFKLKKYKMQKRENEYYLFYA